MEPMRGPARVIQAALGDFWIVLLEGGPASAAERVFPGWSIEDLIAAGHVGMAMRTESRKPGIHPPIRSRSGITNGWQIPDGHIVFEEFPEAHIGIYRSGFSSFCMSASARAA